MYDVFGAVRTLIKFDAVRIDDNAFRVHYRATVVLLLGFTAVLSARQYVGDPIDCVVAGVPSNVMDTYCWIYSTYTVASNRTGVMPGVSPDADGDPVRYHRYYQWVCFVLFVQSLFFYAPRYLWKVWEGGRLRMLSLEEPAFSAGGDEKAEYRELLVGYLVRNLHEHNLYFWRYVLCELLNLVNVGAQMYFLDRFLDGEFTTYGLDVLRFSDRLPEERVDPMARVFPKTTKCMFKMFGPTGSIQKFDGLCVLPLNVVNEKVFVFLWFWFAFVAVVSAFGLLRRVAIVLVPYYRFVLLRASSRLTPANKIRTVNKKCPIGSWFLLHLLSQNIDPAIFKEILSDLARKFHGQDPTPCECDLA